MFSACISPICRRNCVASDRPCTRVTPRNLHGKEGVIGSSPIEGSARRAANRCCLVRLAPGPTCGGMEPSMELDSRRNHEDVGRSECAPSLAQLTRGWRAQWRAALISVNFSLQIGTSASSLRIRVRRFDSSRGHAGCLCGTQAGLRLRCGLHTGSEELVRQLNTAGNRLSGGAHWRAVGARSRARTTAKPVAEHHFLIATHPGARTW
jgi:hypothetical protein